MRSFQPSVQLHIKGLASGDAIACGGRLQWRSIVLDARLLRADCEIAAVSTPVNQKLTNRRVPWKSGWAAPLWPALGNDVTRDRLD